MCICYTKIVFSSYCIGKLMLKLLVVDDSMIIRNMVKRTIESQCDLFFLANDGLEGLNQWRNNKSINVIITDINMPNMDGLTMISALRNEGCSAVILCLTTESSIDKKLSGKEAGADGWLVKPFSPETLIQTIAKAIDKRQARAA